MKIIIKAVSELSEDPANARAHNPKNIEAIKASLKKFGQQKPIVISSKDVVIAGNGTLQAARDLSWDSIECVCSELEGPEQTAFGIADNRTSELASWEDEILGKHLQALREDGWDLGDIGFDIEDVLSYEPNNPFDNGFEEKEDDPQKDQKLFLEIEFTDDSLRSEIYEELLSRGLIVRVKNG